MSTGLATGAASGQRGGDEESGAEETRTMGRRGGSVGRGERKGIAGEGEGERGDRYEVGAAQY